MGSEEFNQFLDCLGPSVVGRQQVAPRSLEKISFHLGFGGTAETEAPQI